MSGMTALFYSDAQPDFVAASGLETLVQYPAVVLQAEMSAATQDSNGRLYAEGMTPAGWLQARGTDVWSYVNPFWAKDSRVWGGPGETFRRAQSLQIEAVDAWLRMSPGGERVPVFGGRMWAVDLRNAAYREWLRLAVPTLPGRDLFIDCGFYHTGGYHKRQGGPDASRAAQICELYHEWRAHGLRLVVNAGWERLDPDAGKAVYPFAGCVDGVAIECPGGQSGPGGWRDLVSYRNVRGKPDLLRLRRVVGDWQALGKAVWLVCLWQRSKPNEYTYSPFPTFEEHASFWIEAAQEMDCSVAVCQDYSHAVWRENWIREWGDGDEPLTTEQRLAAIERRLAVLERQLSL